MDSVGWVADIIRGRKLERPAILFLEMHMPIVGIGHALTLFLSPLLFALGLGSLSKALAEVLESRENIERLIQLLEN